MRDSPFLPSHYIHALATQIYYGENTILLEKWSRRTWSAQVVQLSLPNNAVLKFVRRLEFHVKMTADVGTLEELFRDERVSDGEPRPPDLLTLLRRRHAKFIGSAMAACRKVAGACRHAIPCSGMEGIVCEDEADDERRNLTRCNRELQGLQNLPRLYNYVKVHHWNNVRNRHTQWQRHFQAPRYVKLVLSQTSAGARAREGCLRSCCGTRRSCWA